MQACGMNKVEAVSTRDAINTATVFLVGAFSLKEKSPTLTVSSFFLFFFQLTISLWVVHFSYNLFIFHICSSSIFDPAGVRGFDSRTKP